MRNRVENGRSDLARDGEDVERATVPVMRRVAVLLCLFACSPGRATPPLPRGASPALPVATAERPSEEDPPEELGEPVDVLWGGPSSVAVSSVGHHGRPSALVDGVPATAWEAADDGRGEAISFVVPPGTALTELVLTVGFEGTSTAGDSAVGHRRARKVRVVPLPGTTLPGAALEWTLDSTLRTPQHFPFVVPAHRDEEGPLGFSVVFESEADHPVTDPTRRRDAPFAISEFSARGHLGTRWRVPEPPRVTVGALKPLPDRPPGAFDGFVGYVATDACSSYEEAVTPAIQVASDDFEASISPIPEHSTGPLPQKPWCVAASRRVATVLGGKPPKSPLKQATTSVSLVDLELPNGTARVLRIDLPEGSAFLRGSAVCSDSIAEHEGEDVPCSDDDVTLTTRITAATITDRALTVEVAVSSTRAKGPGSGKRPSKEGAARTLRFDCFLDAPPFGCRRGTK